MFGMPDFSDELRSTLDEGLVVLGGCEILDGQPPPSAISPT
jgi:hypothetical protein